MKRNAFSLSALIGPLLLSASAAAACGGAFFPKFSITVPDIGTPPVTNAGSAASQLQGKMPSWWRPSNGENWNKSPNSPWWKDSASSPWINVSINNTPFTGTLDNGKATAPFSWSMNGAGTQMNLKAKGLDLKQLLNLDATAGSHQVVMTILITATCTNADCSTSTYTLFSQDITLNYTVKNGKVKGKN